MQAGSDRFSFGKLFIEVILIVMGVLLGLLFNEMRLQQQNKERARVAVRQINSEIRHNRDQVVKISTHHAAVRDSLVALLSRVDTIEGPIPFQVIMGVVPGGFGKVGLQRHAWNLAGQLGTLEHVEFDSAVKLSQIYDLQEIYLGMYVHLGDNVFLASNANPDVREGLVLGLALLANDIAHYELNLIDAYDAALEQLETKKQVR